MSTPNEATISREPRRSPALGSALLLVLAFWPHPRLLALGQERYVEDASSPGSFGLVQQGVAAPLCVDAEDYWGVVRAVGDLRSDIGRVTGCTPDIVHEAGRPGSPTVIIGTIGQSRAIDQLIKSGKLDPTPIAGKWESFIVQVVPNPLPGVERGLVIAGSDRRGTIFGVYDVSEQIGVSPWYWWADVPVAHREALFVKPGRFVQGPPAVKYRGIFLNDEAPCLTAWTDEKFGGRNHQFYEKVFELLLRLKANYLWPAMWTSAFDVDDPLNPKLADAYGIVMGTSHEEVMMRAGKEWGHDRGAWNYATNGAELRKFWSEGIERTKDYENIITIGMRGRGDRPMSQSADVALLERVMADQRAIIGQDLHTDPARVPQVWDLYDEVQEYYEKGLRVPDDVTLLWGDDNRGNLRRLPTAADNRRSGGSGIYYHFDYQGPPQSYKWLNTSPITKVWEQMHLAHGYGADRIWIVNVGDLKRPGLEFPIEFFLTYAWDPDRWPCEKLAEYGRLWAEREFGPAEAAPIADLVAQYTKYNGRRKPEDLTPTTFSLADYQEADRIVAQWQALAKEADRIYRRLPAEARDAFFELVLYPVTASAQVNELYITVGRNAWHARQGRVNTNVLAARARALFQADADLSYRYNHVAQGKWDHLADQAHIGSTSSDPPPNNRMPATAEFNPSAAAEMGISVEDSPLAWPGAAGDPVLPPFDAFNRQRRSIDVFNRGLAPFDFQATASVPWISPSLRRGTVTKERRLWIRLDWTQVPLGVSRGDVTVTGAGGRSVTIKVEAFNPPAPSRDQLEGFVEGDGYVSIEAADYARKVDAGPARWEEIPDYGRTQSAMSVFPVTAPSVVPPNDAPRLEYRMYVFHPGAVQVEAIIAPTLNFVRGRGLRFALSFDDQTPRVVDVFAQFPPSERKTWPAGRDPWAHNAGAESILRANAGDSPDAQLAWEDSVEDNARVITTPLTLGSAGYHTLKFWMVDPGVVLEKLVVDLGGLKPSYLGPPESYHRPVPLSPTG